MEAIHVVPTVTSSAARYYHMASGIHIRGSRDNWPFTLRCYLG